MYRKRPDGKVFRVFDRSIPYEAKWTFRGNADGSVVITDGSRSQVRRKK